MRWLGALAIACWLSCPPASADAGTDPLAWLAKAVGAAQRLNYTGTFIYQSGTNSETSRITHVVDGAVEREKLEVLDGSPREVVRMNQEVRCFLPAQRRVIVEGVGSRSVFPGLRPDSVPSISQFYTVRKGDIGRVAGYDAQLLVLEPKDQFRYGHMLWAEMASGLLLKARTINERGETVEQFSFTQVQIGGSIDRASLRSKFEDAGSSDWQVLRSEPTQAGAAEDEGWVFRTMLPGFKRSLVAKRKLKSGSPEATHWVFSDGMAAVSIFVEPVGAGGKDAPSGPFRSGATNGYQRVQGGYLITVVGEVPSGGLKLVADGIEPRRR